MHYSLSWTQPYSNWIPYEPPINDLSQANEVIARIMKL